MDELQWKNDVSDKLFLTAVNVRKDQHNTRFKRHHKRSTSKNKFGKLSMYEEKNKIKSFPKLKREDSTDKKNQNALK